MHYIYTLYSYNYRRLKWIQNVERGKHHIFINYFQVFLRYRCHDSLQLRLLYMQI